MREPKRYFFIGDLLPGQTRYPHHHFVLYDDYAALAAENERRTEQLNQSMAMTDACIENINRLIAQNERLRKAGDAMKHWIVSEGYDLLCVDDWLAAKEGGAK